MPQTTDQPSSQVSGSRETPRVDPLQVRIAVICILTLLSILFIIFASDQAVRLLYRSRQKVVTEQIAFEIDEIILKHFDFAVRHLVPVAEIQQLCAGQRPVDDPAVVKILSTAREVLSADIVYVLDAEGTVIACSTSENDKPLTGKNFRFRPFFAEAVSGKSCHYAAVGVATGKRGIYFSEPVYVNDRSAPAGVMVIQIDLESIDAFLSALKDKQDALLLKMHGQIHHPFRLHL